MKKSSLVHLSVFLSFICFIKKLWNITITGASAKKSKCKITDCCKANISVTFPRFKIRISTAFKKPLLPHVLSGLARGYDYTDLGIKCACLSYFNHLCMNS